MIAYFKDKKTFATKAMAETLEYNITISSIYDNISTLSVKYNPLIANGDYVICGGYFGVITQITDLNNISNIKAYDFAQIFSRNLLVPEDDCSEGIEGFIKRQIDANYINVSDPVYALPFISTQIMSVTPAAVMPDIDGELWNIKSFFSKVRRMYKIFPTYAFGKDSLTLGIGRRSFASKNIDLSLSDYMVGTESFSSSQIAKITTFETSNSTTLDWYLLQDGSITNKLPLTGRATGEWITLVFDNEEDDIASAVDDQFAKSSYSHLIEFSSNQKFDFFTPLTIKTKEGKVLQSYISEITISSTSDYFAYKTGELRITLTDKFNKE